MFRLFLGIATANSIHIPDIDLIGEHRVVGHTLKLNHTVTEVLKTLGLRSLQKFCYVLTLVKFHGIDSALAELPRGWYPFGPFCSYFLDGYCILENWPVGFDWLMKPTGQVLREAEDPRDEIGGQKGVVVQQRLTHPLWSTWLSGLAFRRRSFRSIRLKREPDLVGNRSLNCHKFLYQFFSRYQLELEL